MATATMKVTGIDASYYLVKDLDRSTKFYVDLLGAEPTMHHPEMISEWTFPGGETFGLYKSAEFHPSAGVMFAVPDVPAAIETCKASGVKFDDNGEVTDTPACHMAFAQDTEGNGFILHHRKG